MVKLWLRAETKKNEQRTALSPELCARLIATGFSITAEKCSQRIFKNEEYATAGCAMVEGGSWVDAPLDFIIIGLKELPEMEFALVHTHIMFAHCYKHQDGWETVLERFARGNGTLLDIEFLMLKGFTILIQGVVLRLLAIMLDLLVVPLRSMHGCTKY